MKKILALGLSCLLICGSASGAVIEPDSYDKLFLRCNGTTTTFVDSSTANPKTITANGNATQIPVLEAGKPQAMFFNGTTDYVDIANSADFAFGVGAFEIEFSFMTNKAATAQTIIDNRTATADTDAWLVNIINSSGNKLCFTTATTARITGSTTLAINTKYRCKIVGNGGANGSRTVIMYLAVGDGDYAQEGSTYTADYNFAKQTLRIGSVKAAAGTYYNGWLKNLTLKKATTTVLDMRGNTTATSPLGPAIAFDGTGDYLDLADSADFAPGTGAFTVEGFINTGVPATAQTIYDTRTATANTSGFLINIASSKLCFTTATTARITGGTTLIANRTYHWRVVGNGGADGARTVTLYLNGQAEGSVYTNNYNFTDQTLRIGSIKAAAGTYFNGWMREIRVSNNERNTTAFTPSQTGFTVDANTKLYIKGNEDNGVTTFVDSSTSPKTVTTNGDTKIKYTEDYRSCIFKDETGKFPYPVGSAKVDFMAIGSGAGYFDGTGDYLTTPNSADFDFGTDNLTLEMYIREAVPNARATSLLSKYTAKTGWDLYKNGSVYMNFYDGGATSIGQQTFVAPSIPLANTWWHLALCRVNTTTFRWFFNGTQLGADVSVSAARTFNGPNTLIGIGAEGDGTNPHLGLLDNIRISKGVARYTDTFNPPDDYSAPRIGKRKTNWFFFF